MTPKIVLNSSSSARRMLLSRLHVPFIAATPGLDETPRRGESALALVERLARGKALHQADSYQPGLIIGCDQVLVCNGQIMGKPLTHSNAVQQLMHASGQCLVSYTGLCLYNTETGLCREVIEPFQVYMRQLDLETIERYLALEQPYHCAGSLKAEGLGITLIERMEGNDFNALIGLPLIRLIDMLAQEGVDVLALNEQARLASS